ncbi:MAG: hypothetical protein N2C12_16050, partial [Planctomycetales bacterium]
MSPDQTDRQLIPVQDAFFNDGHWYVMSSTSLGGSGLSSAEIAQQLQSSDAEMIRRLLTAGTCFPVHFPCDCALDDAVIVIGKLSPQEEVEWLGRLRSKLEIPCGEFFIMGGAREEDFDETLGHPTPPDPHSTHFQKVKITPGTYLVEIYAFFDPPTVQ